MTLTGGEPLLQKEMNELLMLLHDKNLDVEVETNGSISLNQYCGSYRPSFTMDYKTPFSGCEDRMCKENFALLNKSDAVKFVVGSVYDMDVARNLVQEYHLAEKCNMHYGALTTKMIDASVLLYFSFGSSLSQSRSMGQAVPDVHLTCYRLAVNAP